ncbi:hypothetical protein BH11ACT6_BH11ACT6_34540 [soil metagenome]
MPGADGFTLQYAIRLPDGSLAINPHTGLPFLWLDPALAEKALDGIRRNAVSIGVPHWSGLVVRQYCSPFVGPADDPGPLIDELSEWLKQQTGEQK